jgi:FtsP/CotA-like multicopper oxidase with cupredoxin domain
MPPAPRSPVCRTLLACVPWLVLACGGGGEVEATPAATPPPTAADRAAAEFEGAYPFEAAPSGTVRDFAIVAAPAEHALPGREPLQVWAYNGTVPGPTLRVRLGETLRVTFTNELPAESTIHWHGVRVPNAMDGVPDMTQPPVPPGGTFVYEYTPKDAGTFWFHPHVRSSEQVERGLYGVLVVEDVAPAAYDHDVVWIVDDWRLDDSGQIDPRFNTRHDLAHDGRWGNLRTVNGKTDEVLAVRPGERIRLRMLNSANGRVVVPDFGDLPAKIIAVDGLYLRAPIDAAGFELAPGNRIDVDVVAARHGSDVVEVTDRFSARRVDRLASIVIDGEGVPTPAFPSPARAHVPTWTMGLEVPVHHTYRLSAEAGGPLGIQWLLDGKAFAGHGAHAGHEADVTLARGKFHRLRFVNESARLHPIHLHGMFFRVLARNGKPADEPFFRDTVLIHGRESIDIGVVPTDAGAWMMHCHILEHAEAGMMTMIDVVDA